MISLTNIYLSVMGRWQVIPKARVLRLEPRRAGWGRRHHAALPARGLRQRSAAARQLRAEDTNQNEHDLRRSAIQSVCIFFVVRVLILIMVLFKQNHFSSLRLI